MAASAAAIPLHTIADCAHGLGEKGEESMTRIDEKSRSAEEAQDRQEPVRYTYSQCLRGEVPVPTHVNGSTLFQVLMVGGMATFMVTINGLRNTGFDFLASSHWLYPLMFALAFLVRTFISAPLANKLAKRFVFGRFDGTVRAVVMTVLNVVCTAPIMCAIGILLLVGPSDFLVRYATTLPLMAPLGALVNYFVVAPVAKLLFFNRISPSGGLGLLSNLEQNAPSLARLLGC